MDTHTAYKTPKSRPQMLGVLSDLAATLLSEEVDSQET